MKLAYSQNSAVLASLALEIEGAGGMLAEGPNDESEWHDYFLGHWSSRIGGGTDQEQPQGRSHPVPTLAVATRPARVQPRWRSTPVLKFRRGLP